MASIGYGICLFISIFVVVWIARKNYSNIDVYYWTIAVLTPLIILGYWLRTRAESPDMVSVLYCFIYLDSTVLLTVLIFSMLRTLGITPKPWIKSLAYIAAFAHMGLIWFTFDNQLYYSSITLTESSLGTIVESTGGPLKILHYIYLAVIITVLIVIVIMGRVRAGTYSSKTMTVHSVMIACGVALYFIEIVAKIQFTFLPYLYTIASVAIAKNYDFIHAHDISGLISSHYDSSSVRGYVAIGLDKTFLCCNAKCLELLPFLKKQCVDKVLDPEDSRAMAILQLIDGFAAGKATSSELVSDEKTFKCEISHFSIRGDGKGQGYLISVYDATEEKRNLEILTDYNNTLNEEVEEKTEHIRSIQRTIVLGMADMIENRDINTGGHVKRTSDIISIIVEEIERQGKLQVGESLASDIVRAAPMHDLGKLQIDSSILCKPGRLTDEEYAIMKTHSTKSSEMVMILLDGVEEAHFVKAAYNIARYHHERWDGKGYPDGLVGEMIPLEARIMAIADVYDALVSKRCYKDAISFEAAAKIMCENMGTQFDPNMRQVFLGCRQRLEEYYRTGAIMS